MDVDDQLRDGNAADIESTDDDDGDHFGGSQEVRSYFSLVPFFAFSVLICLLSPLARNQNCFNNLAWN